MDYVYSEINADVLDAGEIRLDKITASIDNETGIPSIEPSYNSEDKSLHLAFHNLKGALGEEGPQGKRGERGDPSTWEDLLPVGGVKKNELSVEVRNSLDKADIAVTKDTDNLDNYRTSRDQDIIDEEKADKEHSHRIIEINNLSSTLNLIKDTLENKVDIDGDKKLSTNDFTDYYLNKIESVSESSHEHGNFNTLDRVTNSQVDLVKSLVDNNVTGVDGELKDSSNPVKNKVIKEIIDSITSEVLTVEDNISDLFNNKQNNLTEAQKAAVNSSITQGKVDNYDSHVGNIGIHITDEERVFWNEKQTKLNSDQISAVNSGITSTLVDQIFINKSDIETKQEKLTSRQQDAVNSGIDAERVKEYTHNVEVDIPKLYNLNTHQENDIKVLNSEISHLKMVDVNLDDKIKTKADSTTVTDLSDNFNLHKNNPDIHVTSEDRERWDKGQEIKDSTDIFLKESKLYLNEDLKKKYDETSVLVKNSESHTLPMGEEGPLEKYTDVLESICTLKEVSDTTTNLLDNVNTKMDNHVINTDVHLGQLERETWNNKQEKLIVGSSGNLISGNNINMTQDLDGKITISSLIKSLSHVQIGKDLMTTVTVGGLSAGSQINSTDTLISVLEKILTGEPPITHTVTFIIDPTEGESPSPVEVLDGEKISKPEVTTRVGYSFTGDWYKDESKTEYKFDFNSPITEDLTLYGKCEESTCTVSITSSDMELGSVSPNQVNNIKYNSTVTINSDDDLIFSLKGGDTASVKAICEEKTGYNTYFNNWSVESGETITDGMEIVGYFEREPITTKIYYGASTNIPDNLDDLDNEIDVSVIELLDSGLELNIKTGDPVTFHNQFTSIACDKNYKLTEWLNAETLFGYTIKTVTTDTHNIYYKEPANYDEDIGGENFIFKFAEV